LSCLRDDVSDLLADGGGLNDIIASVDLGEMGALYGGFGSLG
jgi:hypothetical protein